MAVFATYEDLRRAKSRVVLESRLLSDAATRDGKSVFLSHSSRDNDLVPGAVQILNEHGGRTYVDLGDSRLPETPSVATAAILRSTIRGTKRFVLLVTANSKGSIWMPWELGLSDGLKSLSDIAVWPAGPSQSNMTWADREYLGLYSRLVWGRRYNWEAEGWIVLDQHQGSAKPLREWLA